MTASEDVDGIKTWVVGNLHEVENVPRNTNAAACYFTILWSIFDLRHLESSARRDLLLAFCNTLPEDVNLAPFEPHLDYFHGRYSGVNGPTDHFAHLVGNDDISSRVIYGPVVSQQGTPKERLTAMIVITYLLRCNLVHGGKYRTGLRDQYDNMMHGCQLMTLILDEAWKPSD